MGFVQVSSVHVQQPSQIECYMKNHCKDKRLNRANSQRISIQATVSIWLYFKLNGFLLRFYVQFERSWIKYTHVAHIKTKANKKRKVVIFHFINYFIISMFAFYTSRMLVLLVFFLNDFCDAVKAIKKSMDIIFKRA